MVRLERGRTVRSSAWRPSAPRVGTPASLRVPRRGRGRRRPPGGGRSLQQPRPALRRRRDHSTARRCLTGNRGRVLGPAAETAFGNPRRHVQALDLESFWLRTRAKPDTRRPCPTVQALHASAGPRLPSTRRCGELPRPACSSRPLAGRDDPPAHGAAHLEVPLPRHPSRPGPAPPPATHLGALSRQSAARPPERASRPRGTRGLTCRVRSLGQVPGARPRAHRLGRRGLVFFPSGPLSSSPDGPFGRSVKRFFHSRQDRRT